MNRQLWVRAGVRSAMMFFGTWGVILFFLLLGVMGLGDKHAKATDEAAGWWALGIIILLPIVVGAFGFFEVLWNGIKSLPANPSVQDRRSVTD
jgi:hypothetical protein